MAIKENRVINIDNRIISLPHLRELAEVIAQEYKLATKKTPNAAHILFTVKCFEPSSFEGEDISLFAENSIISKKRIKSVTMVFSNQEKGITIRLNHGWQMVDNERFSDSDIEISGNDPFWVSGLSDRLNAVINAFPPQNSPIVKHRSKITWAAFICGTIAFGFGVDFLSTDDDGFTPYWIGAFDSVGDFLGLFMFAAMIGGLFVTIAANTYINKAYDLWPTIELQVGPEYSFTEKRKRKLIAYLITLLLIPAIISVISGLIT